MFPVIIQSKSEPDLTQRGKAAENGRKVHTPLLLTFALAETNGANS
jgi:hypothetical protein